MVKINDVSCLIGNTPHLKINRLFAQRQDVEVWLKLEKNMPGGSLKDRIGLFMIEDAEARGILKPGSVIIEPTSGNTGIGLALAAAIKGYKCILTMPDNMTMERKRMMAAFGAHVVLTPKEQGVRGAIMKAEQLCATLGDHGWIPMQFRNPANLQAHYNTTAVEIVNDFPEGIDYLVAGVGTGGHFSGCAKRLKESFPQMKALAVEPMNSSVMQNKKPGMHRLQGIGVGFIPDNMKMEYADGFISVGDDEAIKMAQRCAKEEGMFVGISTGAVLCAIEKLLPDVPSGSKIMTFAYDTGERYVSLPDFIETPDWPCPEAVSPKEEPK